MKLSYSWLKEYIDCDLTPVQIADAMTSAILLLCRLRMP